MILVGEQLLVEFQLVAGGRQIGEEDGGRHAEGLVQFLEVVDTQLGADVHFEKKREREKGRMEMGMR